MLASLLCIQHRQVSGTPFPSVLNRYFYSEDHEHFDENKAIHQDIYKEAIPEIKEYEKEARKSVKDKEKVKAYISVIAAADRVPEEIQPLKDMAINGSLVDKLENQHYDTDVLSSFTVQCYLFYCNWKRQDDEEVLLVLMLS